VAGARVRRGRPVKRTENPLGREIHARLEELALAPTDLAERLGSSRTTVWRLMHGRTQVAGRISLRQLCRALQLEGKQRTDFMQLATGHAPSAHTGARHPRTSFMPTHNHLADDAGEALACASDAVGAERADSATRLRRFLAARLRATEQSHARVARQLGVAPSTLSRLLRGDVKRCHAIKLQVLIRVLGLTHAERPAFLELVVRSELFAVVLHAPPTTRFAGLERVLGASLDEVEQEVEALRARRIKGDTTSAFMLAKRRFHQLFDFPQHASVVLQSSELARVKLRVGFEYCEAQAAALRWYERGPYLIRTLDRMQEEVLLHFPFPAQPFASEYAHLLNLRAPLYRHDGAAPDLLSTYSKSIAELTFGIKRVMPHLAEPTLHSELLRNRAHARLLARDVGGWKADLQAATEIARQLRGIEGEVYQALVEYSWGEGYKRLASQPNLLIRQRQQYLQEANSALRAGELVFQHSPLWRGYALLARIAGAQCLVWSDPEQALVRAKELRTEAQTVYPALMVKIDRAAEAARRRLSGAPPDPVLY
jgi:transcriptional regulator with XRE-family HTH domain